MIKAIAIDDEPLALNVIEAFCSDSDEISLEKTFTQPHTGLNYLLNFPVDLLFLDIRMPELNGINLAKKINKEVMVIFTTAYADYAVQSYELNAIDYLLKPISRKRFEQSVQKALDFYHYQHHLLQSETPFIYIRADYTLIKINLIDILYIEGLADYIKIYTQHQKTIVSRITMKEMMKKLNADFIRVHRSFIIPIQRIQKLSKTKIILPEREIPVGNTYLDAIEKLMLK
ncbi:MAG: LytTR family DNA-binding domain-containing protein [Bacteroidales bacterium]|nr:LytTR family DNA-binding domain-containing protein [Bacteroidales bacterium]